MTTTRNHHRNHHVGGSRSRVEPAGAFATTPLADGLAWAYVGETGSFSGVVPGSGPVSLREALNTVVHELSRPQMAYVTVVTGHTVSKTVPETHWDRTRLRTQAVNATTGELLRRARVAAEWEKWRHSMSAAPQSVRGGRDRRVVIATDGSVRHETGTGVWSWYVSKTVNGCGLTAGASISFVELRAIYEALSRVEVGSAEVTVVSDCQSVVHALGFSNAGVALAELPRTVAGPEERALREETRALIEQLGARVKWVRGHHGHGLHTQADLRARAVLRAHERYTELVAVA